MFYRSLLAGFLFAIAFTAASKEDAMKARDVEAILNRIAELEDRCSRQDKIIERLHSTVEQQQIKLETYKNKMKECQNMGSNDEVALTDLSRRPLRTSKRQADTLVAFSATINIQKIENIGIHQNIVFSDVITNIGNAYNNHHGVFTAPVQGVYLFTTTLLSGMDIEFAAAIEINGGDVIRMFERGAAGRHGSASQMVIVHLNKGDDVAVQSLGVVQTYWGDKYCSFSGVLLKEMEGDASQIVG